MRVQLLLIVLLLGVALCKPHGGGGGGNHHKNNKNKHNHSNSKHDKQGKHHNGNGNGNGHNGNGHNGNGNHGHKNNKASKADATDAKTAPLESLIAEPVEQPVTDGNYDSSNTEYDSEYDGYGSESYNEYGYSSDYGYGYGGYGYGGYGGSYGYRYDSSGYCGNYGWYASPSSYVNASFIISKESFASILEPYFAPASDQLEAAGIFVTSATAGVNVTFSDVSSYVSSSLAEMASDYDSEVTVVTPPATGDVPRDGDDVLVYLRGSKRTNIYKLTAADTKTFLQSIDWELQSRISDVIQAVVTSYLTDDPSA